MLKARFDSKPDFIIERYNALVDEVEELKNDNGEYLPITGGTMSGNILPDAASVYDLGSAESEFNNIYSNYYHIGADNTTIIKEGNGNNSSGKKAGFVVDCYNGDTTLEFTMLNGQWSVIPWKVDNAKITLGTTNFRWGQLFTNTAVSVSSDRNEKNTIEELDENKAAEFILAHKPVSFKYNDGTSDRKHYGLIAQDVEGVLEKLGVSTQDFAGFVKDKKIEKVKTGEDEQGNSIYEFKEVEGEYTYSIRYEEYIAPLMACVKLLLKEREENEKRLKALETRLEALEKGGI